MNFEDRQIRINQIIQRLQKENPFITPSQVSRARSLYRMDNRPLSVIVQELEDFSNEILSQHKDHMPQMTTPEKKVEEPKKEDGLPKEAVTQILAACHEQGITFSNLPTIFNKKPEEIEKIVGLLQKYGLTSKSLPNILETETNDDKVLPDNPDYPVKEGLPTTPAPQPEPEPNIPESEPNTQVPEPHPQEPEPSAEPSVTQDPAMSIDDELASMFAPTGTQDDVSKGQLEFKNPKVYKKEFNDNSGETAGDTGYSSSKGLATSNFLLTVASLFSIMGIVISLLIIYMR